VNAGGDREPNKALVLVAMTGALAMTMLDATVVGVALPSIQRDLGLSATGQQWVMNAYLLAMACFVALAGWLADRVGRIRTFNAGVVIFVLASAAAGASQVFDSGSMLLIARAVEGFGAALMIPSSQSVVTTTFPVAERGRAMGVYAGISTAFLALGPVIGGLVTEHVGWEWVFYINLPIGVLTLVLARMARPDGRPTGDAPLDVPGLILLVAGLAALVVGLMQSSSWGWGDERTIALLVSSAVLLMAMVVVELKRRNPLVDLRLFRSVNFSVDATTLALVQFALVGVSTFGAIYAQDVLDMDPVLAGLSLLPVTIPVLLIARLSGKVYDLRGARLPVGIGSLLAAGALIYISTQIDSLGYAVLVPGYIFLGLGVALIMVPATTDAMNATPLAKQGQGAGLLMTVRNVGGSVGLAVLTSVIIDSSRDHLDASLVDKLTAAGVADPTTKAKTLEGLLSQSQGAGTSSSAELASKYHVPASAVDEVTQLVKESYAYGMNRGFLVAGLVMLLAAALALGLLRRLTTDPDRPGVAVG
jgi:EmrB/QacA subfamily drug resistance transporter